MRIKIGEVYEDVDKDLPFKQTIVDLAKKYGLVHFRVFVDGQPITPDQAPTDFSGLSSVEIRKYDVGG